jgi:hypothetical protein
MRDEARLRELKVQRWLAVQWLKHLETRVLPGGDLPREISRARQRISDLEADIRTEEHAGAKGPRLVARLAAALARKRRMPQRDLQR